MRVAALAALLAGATFLATAPVARAQHRFHEADLVSDVQGRALHTDSHLVNPWGIVPGPTGIFWVSDNEPGVSTLYEPDGTPRSLVVTIPGGKPTGVVLAASNDSAFAIPSGDSTVRAIFIFATENGTIAAWSPKADSLNAIQVVSTTDGIYKGLALAYTSAGPRLYAANFHAGTVDVFNRHFLPITLAGNFTDPNLPDGYGPFNIADVNGEVFVSYAKQDANKEDDVAGAGFGFIDVFDREGNFLRRYASNGALNAPWGMVAAPPGYGGFAHALLVGNFGDGAINAFDLPGGAPVGALQDSTGSPLAIEGLWGLHFGAAASGSTVANRLYFAAGFAGETHGLFGYLSPMAEVGPVACTNEPRNLASWRKLCGFPVQDHGRGQGDDHRHRFGNPDSMRVLFDCIAGDSRAFGSSGCFTAGCDLLNKVGRRSVRERAAQQFLALLINRCAGRICDTLTIHCATEGDDESGDDDHADTTATMTVGDLVSRLDEALCDHASDRTVAMLGALAACANESGGDETSDGDEDRASGSGGSDGVQLTVKSLGANPVRLTSGLGARFMLSATQPVQARLGIYDAAGRLVAEPLRDAAVSDGTLVHWDGRDVSGRLVVPGTYFYRAISGRATSTGRIVVIR